MLKDKLLRKKLLPKRNPFQKNHHKLVLLIEGVLLLLVIFLSYLGLVQMNVKQANYAIDETMTAYFTAMNQQDYRGMGEYLYPTEQNEDYLLSTAVKAKIINMESIRLQKIYPALVHGDIAIAGFETSTNSVCDGETTTIRETNTFFFLKQNGKWYIAKPEDLKDKSLVHDMIGKYNPVLKENMAGGIKEQQIYNQISYDKVNYPHR